MQRLSRAAGFRLGRLPESAEGGADKPSLRNGIAVLNCDRFLNPRDPALIRWIVEPMDSGLAFVALSMIAFWMPHRWLRTVMPTSILESSPHRAKNARAIFGFARRYREGNGPTCRSRLLDQPRTGCLQVLLDARPMEIPIIPA